MMMINNDQKTVSESAKPTTEGARQSLTDPLTCTLTTEERRQNALPNIPHIPLKPLSVNTTLLPLRSSPIQNRLPAAMAITLPPPPLQDRNGSGTISSRC